MSSIKTYDQALALQCKSKVPLGGILRAYGIKDLGRERFRQSLESITDIPILEEMAQNVEVTSDEGWHYKRAILVERMYLLENDPEKFRRLLNNYYGEPKEVDKAYGKLIGITSDARHLCNAVYDVYTGKSTKERAAKKLVRLTRQGKVEVDLLDYVADRLGKRSPVAHAARLLARDRRRKEFEKLVASKDLYLLRHLARNIPDVGDPWLEPRLRNTMSALCADILKRSKDIKELESVCCCAPWRDQRKKARAKLRRVVIAGIPEAQKQKDGERLKALYGTAKFLEDKNLMSKAMSAFLTVDRTQAAAKQVLSWGSRNIPAEKEAVLRLTRRYIKAIVIER